MHGFSRLNIDDFWPLAELGLPVFLPQDRLHPKSKRSLWHQIRDYAFMSFSFVDKSELLHTVDLHSNSILKNVQQLLLNEFAARPTHMFLKVLEVWPGYLYRSWRLRHMSEFPWLQRFFTKNFNWLHLINEVCLANVHGWRRSHWAVGFRASDSFNLTEKLVVLCINGFHVVISTGTSLHGVILNLIDILAQLKDSTCSLRHRWGRIKLWCTFLLYTG